VRQFPVLFALCSLRFALCPLLSAQATEPRFPGPAPKYEVDIEKDVMVPMRDGVKLATDIYRPRGVSSSSTRGCGRVS